MSSQTKLYQHIFRTTTTNCLLKANRKSVRIANVHLYSNFNSRSSPILLCQVNLYQKKFCSSSSLSFLKNIFTVNAESPSNISQNSNVPEVEYIPPPPEPPEEVIEESLKILNSIGEQSLHSLGLGGYSPIGLIQQGIELIHVHLDLPWFGAIALATLILRICLFPLVIVSQRNAVKMANMFPQIQSLQMKMTNARNTGNHLEAARTAYDLQILMKKNDISPLKSVWVPLAQAPIFISMFIGLRRCANLPVESFKEGGIFWFTDLTIADPYYLLPLITSATLLLTIELGTEGQKLNAQTSILMRYGLRALPIIVFPFTLQFPAAVLCYWTTANFCSLAQVGFLRIPAVSQYFNIGQKIKHDPGQTKKNKGFVTEVKEAWSNMKVNAEISDRQKFDEIQFQKAGSGPLVKTYKNNPMKKPPIDVKAKIKS